MEKVNIQGVPETMLQTLFARAAHSQKKGLRFYDGKAIEMVQQLDYDFSKAEKDTAHCVSIFVTSQHYRCLIIFLTQAKLLSDLLYSNSCGIICRFHRSYFSW